MKKIVEAAEVIKTELDLGMEVKRMDEDCAILSSKKNIGREEIMEKIANNMPAVIFTTDKGKFRFLLFEDGQKMSVSIYFNRMLGGVSILMFYF